MTRVTIYQSGKPQFYGTFDNPFDAEKYRAMWRGLAVKAGILIRIDLEEVK